MPGPTYDCALLLLDRKLTLTFWVESKNVRKKIKAQSVQDFPRKGGIVTHSSSELNYSWYSALYLPGFGYVALKLRLPFADISRYNRFPGFMLYMYTLTESVLPTGIEPMRSGLQPEALPSELKEHWSPDSSPYTGNLTRSEQHGHKMNYQFNRSPILSPRSRI